MDMLPPTSSSLRIGWAQVDITPEQLPVYISGQFHIRVSEGIRDRLEATALALESGGDHVIFVAVDAISISDELRDAVRANLTEPGLDPLKVILHATHSHETPCNWLTAGTFPVFDPESEGIDLGIVPAGEYIHFAAERIAGAVSEAWRGRAPGGVAHGQDFAVVGRNRRWSDWQGKATMYRLSGEGIAQFSHIEGYEDHSLNLLATYGTSGQLTGLVVNLPCPSQEDEQLFELSADFWCETRQELRRRFGNELFILPQCSAAGELTSRVIFETKAHLRMLELRGRTMRQEIAMRIADAVERIVPYLSAAIDLSPGLEHRHAVVKLPMNALSEDDLAEALEQSETWQKEYEARKQECLANPQVRDEPRWYVPLSFAFNRAGWYRGVVQRYEKSRTAPWFSAEVHVLRLGEIAFASNPFEYYLDFGIQLKVKSPATQTFLIQLAGKGTYVPSPRAVAGGGYGAVPASNPVGAEGGQCLAEFTLAELTALFHQ